jgi:ribose 5-phosphate isomerase B
MFSSNSGRSPLDLLALWAAEGDTRGAADHAQDLVGGGMLDVCNPAYELGKIPQRTIDFGGTEMEDKQYVIAVGSDDAGVNLKDFIRDQLRDDPRVGEVMDFGVADAEDKTAYPVVCIKAAEAVANGEADRAVLFGGTGLGEAISANKVRGIRAVVAHDPYSIERSILSNNCQVLCLGERVTAPELADRIVKQWLDYEFDPSSPSAAKVQVLTDYEESGSL